MELVAMRSVRIFLIISVLAALAGLTARGQSVPQLIKYQGRLTDPAGVPLGGVTVDMTFSFYSSASGGGVGLSVVQKNVSVAGGVYNVLIGSGQIVPGTESSLADVFGKHRNVWMGVKVDSDPETAPRSRITSAGYAIKAGRVDPGWLDAYMATADYDGDGHTKLFSGGDDCNDGDPSIYPAAPEVYGDGIDQDCDGRDPDKFLIDPHLQLGNQSASPGIANRITVAWETATPQTGTVLYGSAFPPANQADDPVSSAWHEVDITGLSPDTIYYYQVAAGTSVGPVSSFTTAPTDLHEPFRFAVIGDSRTGHDSHRSVIKMMIGWSPAFYVHLGDMVNLGRVKSQWVTHFGIETPLARSAPVAPTYGNHDVGLYDEYFCVPVNLTSNEWYYSWDYGNIHFVHAGTETTGAARDSALFADLGAALASYPNPRFIVVLMHRLAYANGGHLADANYNYSTIWGPRFETNKVALVIQAHNHYYERFEPIDGRAGLGNPPGDPDEIRVGVTYMTSGGGGAPLYSLSPPPGNGGGGTPNLDSLVGQRTNEAMRVDVDGGRMHVLVQRPSDLQVIDEFYVIRNQAPAANAGQNFSGTVSALQTLDGSSTSDTESDPLTYLWIQTSGTSVTLNNPDTKNPTFTPTTADVYTFELTASDGIDQSTDSVSVTIGN